ncbi:MAG TPA: type VI secretion system baseplate subunit TssE [Candidatus Limnocylindrales bacterium]|nr:type VI secretion system baseplate subunit TssE [Candidatus Limnocylindrales bacterium]
MEPRDEYEFLGREPKPIRGLRTPLFDRLQDTPPGRYASTRPARVFGRRELRESVRVEVARILNTRAHLKGESQSLAEGTVLDYGLPDFYAYSASSNSDLEQLANTIAKKIAAGEPRLSEVRVLLKADPTNPKAVLGIIRASLRLGTVIEPVNFPLSLDSQSGFQVSESPGN